jgi:hypothetical protein
MGRSPPGPKPLPSWETEPLFGAVCAPRTGSKMRVTGNG